MNISVADVISIAVGLLALLIGIYQLIERVKRKNREATVRLAQAASHLASPAMLTHLQDWPDDTHVQIKVDAPDGFTRHLSLGEYRRFVTELLKFTAD